MAWPSIQNILHNLFAHKTIVNMKTIYSLPRLYAWLACLLIGFATQARGEESVVVSGTTIEITVSQAGEFTTNYADADVWQEICPSSVVRLKVKGPINSGGYYDVGDLETIISKLSPTLQELDLSEATCVGFAGIGYCPFWDYKDYFRYISLPTGLIAIREYAFQDCSELEEVVIPEGVTEIDEYSFDNCVKITSLTIPSTVVELVSSCFSGCENTLLEIHMKPATPPTGSSFFNEAPSNTTLFVPLGTLSAYQTSEMGQEGWKEIKEEEETLDEDEFVVIQQLYTDLQGANWTRPWQLGSTAAQTSSLEGIIINNGHIVGIDLHDNNLVGALPTYLFNLPALSNINLSGNQLTGDLTTLFAEMDANSTITTLDIEHNLLTGNLYNLTQKLTALTTLKASHNRIRDIYPTPPERIKTLEVWGQDLTDCMVDGDGNPIDLATLCNQSLDPHTYDTFDVIPTVMLLRKYYVVYSGYYYDSSAKIGLCDNWTNPTWMATLQWRYNSTANYFFEKFSDSTNSWYRGNSDVNLYAFVGTTDASLDSRNECHRFQMNLRFQPGDVNYDGSTNLTDMQLILNTALSANNYDVFNFTAANIIATDDSINVQDVVACINILLDQGMTPSLARASQSLNPQLPSDDAVATLTIDGQGRLMLNSAMPVAALELQLSDGDVQWASAMSPFSHASRKGHHIFYSLFDDELPAGSTMLATTTARVVAADAVGKDGRRIPLSINQGVTDAIGTIANRPVAQSTKYFDLQGRQFAKRPSHSGVYIQDGKKIVVK